MAIAAARITTRHAIPGGHEVITWTMRKPAARDMRSPFPPAWPWQVEPEMGLLRAFVDIVEAQADHGQQLGKCLECDGEGCETCGGGGQRSHAGDPAAMVALFESALRRVEAREQGRLSAADRRRGGEPIYAMTDELRALFGQGDPVRALIGGADDKGRWQPGLAGLTPTEQEAYWLHLHGLSRSAIAMALAPQRRRRFGREGAIPLATVSKNLWRARVKLRGVFVLAPEREAAYLAELDAEEARAAAQERAVDPAIAAAVEVERERQHLAWPARWEELPEPAAGDEEPWLDDIDHDPNEVP